MFTENLLEITSEQVPQFVTPELALSFKEGTDGLMSALQGELTAIAAKHGNIGKFVERLRDPKLTKLILDPDDNCEILYSPEIWAKKLRIGQPTIKVNFFENINSSRFLKMEYYFELLNSLSNSITDETIREEFKKIIKQYEMQYREMLDNYIKAFLTKTHQMLQSEIPGCSRFDIHHVDDEPIKTSTQALVKKWELENLTEKLENENLQLYLAVSNLIIDRYYFNPQELDNNELMWVRAKMLCMLVAALCALGSLICVILTPFCPAAAIPGFILGKIALAGLIPGIMDLIHFFKNRCPVSCKPADIIFGMVIPIVMAPMVLATNIITLPRVAAEIIEGVVAGLLIVTIFENIGGFVLNTFGTLLNSRSFCQTNNDVEKVKTGGGLVNSMIDSVKSIFAPLPSISSCFSSSAPPRAT